MGSFARAAAVLFNPCSVWRFECGYLTHPLGPRGPLPLKPAISPASRRRGRQQARGAARPKPGLPARAGSLAGEPVGFSDTFPGSPPAPLPGWRTCRLFRHVPGLPARAAPWLANLSAFPTRSRVPCPCRLLVPASVVFVRARPSRPPH